MACFQATMPLSPGTRLGHYDVTALLGEGGMGQVGVVLILDIRSGRAGQAARTAFLRGRSVSSTAGPHRSLRADARSWTMC